MPLFCAWASATRSWKSLVGASGAPYLRARSTSYGVGHLVIFQAVLELSPSPCCAMGSGDGGSADLTWWIGCQIVELLCTRCDQEDPYQPLRK